MCLKLVRKRACCGEKVQICALLPCSSPDLPHCIEEREHPRLWKHRCQQCQVNIAPNLGQLSSMRVEQTAEQRIAQAALGQLSAMRAEQTTAQRIAQEVAERIYEGRLTYPASEETHSDATEGLPGVLTPGNNTPPRGHLGPRPIFAEVRATSPPIRGVIYDAEGQPLPGHLQPLLGSPLTKDEVKKGFKERQKAANPAMSEGDIDEDWRLVKRQLDLLTPNQQGDLESQSASTSS